MIVKTENLYNFSETAEILGITQQRLFEISASPFVEKLHIGNRVYFTKETVKRLVMRGDI